MSKALFFGSQSWKPGFVLLLGLFPLLVNAAPSSLGCEVNRTDGVSLKTGQTMIENTTSNPIAQGTMVEATVQVGPGIGKVKFVTSRVSAFGTLQKGDKMSVGDTPPNARSCTAKISLIQPKTTVTNKVPPTLGK